ncbi:MAG: 16S rRNA (uracil(1498)-N(3))-methyltransferase [Firmicutes bacterium]|nr:16S rRNA (uracil(1498)-N(3))-methyltransferase [Bacillota bacterium]
MHQFFVETGQIEGSTVTILGADVNHIGRVLRMKPGDEIRVSDRSGASCFCAITAITPQQVTAQILRLDEDGTELPMHIILYQGLPKSDKMELIIQKAVELGACEIVPVMMKNCVVKIVDKKVDGKTKRWQLIAESAAKQSKRSLVPAVRNPITFKEFLRETCDSNTVDLTLIAYENERGMDATRQILQNIAPGQTVGLLIGPEGGISPEEMAACDERPEKLKRISLGRRILRTETAGLAALAMLVYQLDR